MIGPVRKKVLEISPFEGASRRQADRMSASAFARRVRIQTCNKIVKGVRCEQVAAVSRGSRHRCIEHLVKGKRK